MNQNKIEKKIVKELGNYFVVVSDDGFETSKTIATASNRALAEKKLREGVNER